VGFDVHLANLIVRAGKGDKAAMGILYEATSAMLYGLVLRIVADRPTAEDVLGDVYVQAWETADRFDPGRGAPMAWLYMIARSRALDALRRAARGNRERIDEVSERGEPASEPEVAGDAAARRREVHRAMDALTGAQREVIELAFFRGYSQSQIADRLGQPLGTVKTRIRAAMQKLRDGLLDPDRTAAEGKFD
jgi:RNA polymerase sigma-70 factor (ECF subfamily)